MKAIMRYTGALRLRYVILFLEHSTTNIVNDKMLTGVLLFTLMLLTFIAKMGLKMKKTYFPLAVWFSSIEQKIVV